MELSLDLGYPRKNVEGDGKERSSGGDYRFMIDKSINVLDECV